MSLYSKNDQSENCIKYINYFDWTSTRTKFVMESFINVFPVLNLIYSIWDYIVAFVLLTLFTVRVVMCN